MEDGVLVIEDDDVGPVVVVHEEEDGVDELGLQQSGHPGHSRENPLVPDALSSAHGGDDGQVPGVGQVPQHLHCLAARCHSGGQGWLVTTVRTRRQPLRSYHAVTKFVKRHEI